MEHTYGEINLPLSFSMLQAFQAGIVWVNCSQPTLIQAPWGGNKRSGFGRELGEWYSISCCFFPVRSFDLKGVFHRYPWDFSLGSFLRFLKFALQGTRQLHDSEAGHRIRLE